MARPGMVQRHREWLEELTAAVEGVISSTAPDDLERSGGGLALLMFAAELAPAVRPDEYRSMPSVKSARAQSWTCHPGSRGGPVAVEIACHSRLAAAAPGR